MIRTLCTLAPSTKADGARCLRGELSRALTTTSAGGTQRHYPAGTGLVLVKNASGSYSLLATLPDPEPEDFARERAEILASEPDPSYW